MTVVVVDPVWIRRRIEGDVTYDDDDDDAAIDIRNFFQNHCPTRMNHRRRRQTIDPRSRCCCNTPTWSHKFKTDGEIKKNTQNARYKLFIVRWLCTRTRENRWWNKILFLFFERWKNTKTKWKRTTCLGCNGCCSTEAITCDAYSFIIKFRIDRMSNRVCICV